MKKKILLLSALVASAAVTAQTQLPNSSFEDMTEVTVDRSTYAPPASTITYDSLHGGWLSGNEVFKNQFIGNATDELFAQDTSDASEGTHALLLRTHITTQNPGGIVATGNTGFGVWDDAAANPFNSVKQGLPFADRPTSLLVDYKYYNNVGDSCMIASVLTKWNVAESKRDTIGISVFVSTMETSTTDWTEQELTYDYLSSETPDTISVLFVSSKGGFVESLSDQMVGQDGATLIVDNLVMDYTTSISEVSEEFAKIYTINNVINVDMKESASVRIVSINGATVYTGRLTSGNNTINVNHSGLFIVNVTVNGNTSSKKVVLK